MIHDFTHFAGAWRGQENAVSGLERLTIPRMTFLRASLLRIPRRGPRSGKKGRSELFGLKVLDLGCGGGLVSEALCSLGVDVMAVDANPDALAHVKKHTPSSARAKSVGSIRTLCADVYDVEQQFEPESFDAVVCLEVLEHVSNPGRLIHLAAGLVRPGGCVIVSTLNRTFLSFVLGIICAEYVLGWAPRGCHDFRDFIKPKEMTSWMKKAELYPEKSQGIAWSYTQGGFALSQNDAVNYMMTAWKALPLAKHSKERSQST